MRLAVFAVALALTTSAFGQEQSGAVRSDTGSDLLWKKLEARVDEVPDQLDDVMGVALLDLTDHRTVLSNAERVFPDASSITLAIFRELQHKDHKDRAAPQG